jgi:2-succinyl-6-hydroxy-2,4-cyclohexadiene-1-carboxylate synthase
VVLHHRLVPRDRSTPIDHTAPDKLILAHGFTQNTECWGRFGTLLSESADLVLVDAPGHGLSDHDEADLPTTAGLLTDVGGRGVYVGYSMGGRVALHAALSTPDLVRGLVLIGATAGLDSAEDRAARQDADHALADRILADGLEQFIERWLANPLFSGLDDAAAAKDQRLTNRADGLAASLRNCGTGTQEPLWDRLHELTMPVLIVAGDEDQKFTAIGQRMAEAMTNSAVDMLILPGTHAVHLEEPDLTAASILSIVQQW